MITIHRLCITSLTLFTASISSAYIYAYDNANDPTYDTNWTTEGSGSFGDNGGTGFLPWVKTTGQASNSENFVYTSRHNGFGTDSPNIDTNFRSFGLTSFGGGQITVKRTAWSSTAIQMPDRFTCDVDNGSMVNGNFRIGTETLESRFGVPVQTMSLIADGNLPTYYFSLTDGFSTDSYVTNLALTDTGVHLEIEKIGTHQVLFRATRLIDNVSDSHIFTLSNPSGTMATFVASSFSNSAFPAARYEDFFNNIQFEVVPEPGSMATLGLGIAGLVARRRRR